MRKTHLDDGLNTVVQRIRNVRAGRKPDKGPPKDKSAEAQGSRFIKLATSLFNRALNQKDDNQRRHFAVFVRGWAEEVREKAMPQHLKFIKGRYHKEKLAGIVPYAGGKGKQVDDLLGMIGYPARQNLVYVEACVGAGAVLLNAIKRGLVDWIWINDIDPATCAMWNAIIHYPELLREEVAQRAYTPTGFKENILDKASVEESVRICQNAQPGATKMDIVELAYHAMVAHRGTVSARVGADKTSVKDQKKLNKDWTLDKVSFDIEMAHYLLSQCAIWQGECTCLDTVDLVKQVPVESFIFLDPPYRMRGGDNYSHDMTPENHRYLAASLLNSTVPWLLTYDDCYEVRTLYGIPHDPPIRENLPRPTVKEVGKDESQALKERVEADVHCFIRTSHQEHKNIVEQQKGSARAMSSMVEYTMGRKHVWKPDLRIRWTPDWFSQRERSSTNIRVMYDESGQQYRVPVTGMKSEEGKQADILKVLEDHEDKWPQKAREAKKDD